MSKLSKEKIGNYERVKMSQNILLIYSLLIIEQHKNMQNFMEEAQNLEPWAMESQMRVWVQPNVSSSKCL